jgi:hypothetical protein
VAGSAVALTVVAVDPYGNTDTNYRGRLTFTSSDPTASLPGPYTFTAADAGSHTFSCTLTRAGTPTVTLTDNGVAPLTVTASISIRSAGVRLLQLSAPTTAIAEMPFAVSVTALDPFGNVATAYQGTVLLSSSLTGAGVVLPGPYTFTTGSPGADNGQHTFSGLALIAGPATLTASDSAAGLQGTAPVSVSNPVPTLSSLSPSSGPVQGPDMALGLTGTNFVHDSVVQVNGTALPTTFISATRLSTTLPASVLAHLATLSMSVVSAAPGGGTSAALPFVVRDIPPAVTATRVPPLLPYGPAELALASFTYSWAAPASQFMARIDWGDGSASTGTITLAGSTYSITAVHMYPVPGVYHIAIEITDANGGPASASTPAVVGDANQRVLAALYQDLLGRPIDGNGLPYWNYQLQQGKSLAQVALAIAHSSEHLAAVVRESYHAILGRAADAGGLQYWTSQLQAGLSAEQLRADLLASPEFYAQAGGNTESWLGAVYQEALSRPADGPGEGYWLTQLGQGTSRASVALALATSPEARAVVVEQDYRRWLERSAGAAEAGFWATLLLHGTPDDDVAAAILGSPEYFQVHTKLP